jgi:hypothetical protein
MHLAFSPDGARLAVAGMRGRVQVWEIAVGKVLYEMSTPRPWHIAWHPRGDLLAVACHDKNVHLWDGATGKPHLILRGHQGVAVGVSFVADGDVLVSTDWDGSSRLWDPWSGRELLPIAGDAHHASRDGRHVASRAGETLTVWEVKPSREYRTLPHIPAGGDQQHVGQGGFSRDGRWLAAATGDGVWLWDLATGKASAFAPERIGSDAQFHPSGKDLFTCGAAGLYRWPFHNEGNVVRVGPPRKLPVSGSANGLSLDATGRTLAVIDGNQGGWLLDLEDPVPSACVMLFPPLSPRARTVGSRWTAVMCCP